MAALLAEGGAGVLTCRGQPRQSGIGFKTRFRHYVNLSRTESRLARLLDDFEWGRMDDIFLGERFPVREMTQPVGCSDA